MLGRQIWRNLTGSMSLETYKLMYAGSAIGFVVVYASIHMESFWALIFGLFTIVCWYGVLSLPVKLWRTRKRGVSRKLNLFSLDILLTVSGGVVFAALLLAAFVNFGVAFLLFTLFSIVCGYGVCSLMVNWLLNSKSEKIKNLWKLNALLAVSVNTIVPGSAHLMVGMLLLCAAGDRVVKRMKG